MGRLMAQGANLIAWGHAETVPSVVTLSDRLQSERVKAEPIE